MESVGERFGRMTVESISKEWKRPAVAVCLCDCGLHATATVNDLRTGNTKSCGCWNLEVATDRLRQITTLHGLSSTSTYKSWDAMIQRCTNPKAPNYPGYGGRGVSICPEWMTFESFVADMGLRPSRDLSLDRIDVNGNYEPGNCKWSTRSQQQRNKRPFTHKSPRKPRSVAA